MSDTAGAAHGADSPSAAGGPAATAPDDRAAARDYVNRIAAARGYVLPFHSVLAANDFPVLQGFNGLVQAAYLDGRSLSRGVKELLFIATLTVLRASEEHIASHIRVALANGVTAQEILEALELLIPEAGVVAFQHGFDVWRKIVDAPALEPDIPIDPAAGAPAPGARTGR